MAKTNNKALIAEMVLAQRANLPGSPLSSRTLTAIQEKASGSGQVTVVEIDGAYFYNVDTNFLRGLMLNMLQEASLLSDVLYGNSKIPSSIQHVIEEERICRPASFNLLIGANTQPVPTEAYEMLREFDYSLEDMPNE